MLDDLTTIDPQFQYLGDRAKYVRFPLGGIGSGGFSISGSGRLVDWSIRNRPALQSSNGYSHFAIKAVDGDRLVDARVLNGPYDGDPAGSPGLRPVFDGFGHGANRQSLAGVPHFSDVAFYGRFPTADLTFRDAAFPGSVRLTAFSPFIPHEDRDSSMPVAMLRFEITNSTGGDLDYTLAGTLGNHGSNSGAHDFRQADGISALTMRSTDTDLVEWERGNLAIATDAGDVQHQDHHFRGQWFDDITVWWKDFARPGALPPRHYDTPRRSKHMHLQPEHGSLAARVRVPAGQSRTFRFVISWSFPRGDIYWAFRDKPDSPIPNRPTPGWTNYYATQWPDALASAREALLRWDALADPTFAFRDAMFGSSLPAPILDAATATLAILRTATIIRLEGGQLWAWEGEHSRDGSCEGSCTHVWNYAQALAHLFPALERTFRDTEWAYNQLPTGGLTFRQKLPLGSGFDIIGPCADGHFGAIIKTYRDWRQSGDTHWLRGVWPSVRRAVEYAWSAANPDRWDPEQTGILQGRQHQTLDMELFGPNSWLGSMYVAALLAASGMAEALTETDFAGRCANMARAGAHYIETALYNGRYFQQLIDLGDSGVLAPFDTGRSAGILSDDIMTTYWSVEHDEIKYQFGAACIADQILGQWHAEIAGLGAFLDRDKIRSALAAVHRENFRASLKEHFNPGRSFAYEDEAALLIATYPAGTHQPVVSAPYAEEAWTGIEYASASHMIMHGLVEEGLQIATAVRKRYDGARRNPFSEIECGSYYGRSMSAWQLVNAWSGFHCDMVDRRLSFAPTVNGDYRLPWSAGGAWGLLVRAGSKMEFHLLGGKLPPVVLQIHGRQFDVVPVRGEAIQLV